MALLKVGARSRCTAVAMLLMLALMPWRVWSTELDSDLERQVKAAFLFKFSSYVEWPEEVFAGSDAPFVIGVVASDQLADDLTQVVGQRNLNGRQVSVRRVRTGESVSDVQVLFVGQSGTSFAAQLLALTRERPVLTVTESENAFAQGSVINFVTVDKRVRFEVSLEAAQRSHLRLSAPLLSVALRVRDRTP
jgi:hypothetical protein